MSKTDDALRFIDQDGLSPYAAAKKAGITPTTVYVALKRREAAAAAGKEPCPCCGTLVPGEKINRDVLKAD